MLRHKTIVELREAFRRKEKLYLVRSMRVGFLAPAEGVRGGVGWGGAGRGLASQKL
jgi:hypothetical protein